MELKALQTVKKVHEAGMSIYHLCAIETDDEPIKSALDSLSKEFDKCSALILSQISDEYEKDQRHRGQCSHE